MKTIKKIKTNAQDDKNLYSCKMEKIWPKEDARASISDIFGKMFFSKPLDQLKRNTMWSIHMGRWYEYLFGVSGPHGQYYYKEVISFINLLRKYLNDLSIKCQFEESLS